MIKRLLFILWGLLIHTALAAQKTPLDSLVSVDFKNEALGSCIRKLQNETGVFFTYSVNDLDAETRKVTAGFRNRSMAQVLDVTLKNTGLDYKYLGGQVIIFKKKGKYTISGFIKDAQSGEVLIGASVFIKEPLLGTTTNGYGFYSLSLPENNYELFVMFLSEEKKAGRFYLRSDTAINVVLSSAVELSEVEVKAPDVKNKVNTVVTSEKIDIEAVKKIPTPFGEPDILRVIQMLPGIQTTGEASLGYYVRGGSFSQNLVLLDDAPVYNPTHLMGIVSAFNTDMVKSVDFFKGGIPAGYQSGASSVLDIRTKDGNDKSFHGGGGLGLVSSRLFVEGPIKKEKGSFFLAGRKSLLTDQVLKSGFHDINLKASYSFDDRNRLYISAYSGKDRFNYDTNATAWNNSTFTLRYNHIYNGKLFSNTSLIYSKFKVSNTINVADNLINVFTEQFVENRIGKFVLSYFPRPGTFFNGGIYVNDQTYSPFTMHIKVPGLDTIAELSFRRRAMEAALFIEAEHALTRSVSFNVGVRAPMFRDNSNGVLYAYNMESATADSVVIRPTTFKALEPRASVRFLLNRNQSIKASFNHINQFQQQFQGGSLFNLVQVWLPSSSALKPQTVDQFSLGYFLKNKKIFYSLETFYKRIRHASDFIDGAQLISGVLTPGSLLDIETLVKDGTARSYGLELAVSKTEGRFTGWINYTLAKTTYKIHGINDGKSYPASFDNRHTLSVGLGYEINKKWEFSSAFSYRSGRAFSFPDSYYELNGTYYSLITERNKERTVNYHRLDISFIYKPVTKSKRFLSTWAFSLINVYNKFNPTYYMISGLDIRGYALFPVFPSVTYNFRF